MDIPKLNRMDFLNKAIALTKELSEKLMSPDQDVLNILFEDNFKELDPSFNFFNVYSPELQVDPIIVHHVGNKPWRQPTYFQRDFGRVLVKSVFFRRVFEKCIHRRQC